jgi:hypothetical protein
MIKRFLLKKHIIFIGIIVFLVCFSYFENNNIVISKYNEVNALYFIDKIKSIAPIYYVNGKHEG